MAYIKLDKTNRITAASLKYHCGDGEIKVAVPDEIDINNIYNYLYVNGEFIYKPDQKADNDERIAELKARLESTDYVVLKVVEGAATWDEYPDIRDQRQAWRDEINELERNKGGQ